MIPEHILEKTWWIVRKAGGQPKAQVVLRADGLVVEQGKLVAMPHVPIPF